jgi:hypothetical protein
MGGRGVSIDGAKKKSAQLSRKARPWIARLARFGYAAKGIVYLIIGVLAAMAAFDVGGRTTDSRGALAEIVRQPYGRLLLGVVAVGLAGYALWRLVQSLKDTEHKGADLKGLAIRFGYACIGFIYIGLAYSAARLILGHDAGQSSDETSKEWTARLLALPYGQWLVGAAGLAFIGFAGYQFYKSFKAKFRKELKKEEMTGGALTLATRSGQVGLTARGVVFAIIGLFLIQSALTARANEARGLSGALSALEQQPYGPWVLGVVALGLVAYGLHMLILAWYRRFNV